MFTQENPFDAAIGVGNQVVGVLSLQEQRKREEAQARIAEANARNMQMQSSNATPFYKTKAFFIGVALFGLGLVVFLLKGKK